MPEYPRDPDTDLPVSGIPEPTPAESLGRIAANTADLAPLLARVERVMAQLAEEIARWPRPIPPSMWDRLVDEATERLRERTDGG